MAFKRVDNIVIENAQLIFRNFAGEGSMYTRDGNRNFCVFIDDDKYADKLAEEGWNIKMLKPRDEEEEPRYYIQVTVSYRNIPPKVYLVKNKSKKLMSEETIDILDYAEIANTDLIIRPYSWEMNGNSGIKAYLKTMYVTLEEDEFASKYEFEDDDDPFENLDEESLPF